MKIRYFCEYCGGGIDNAGEKAGTCQNCGAPFRAGRESSEFIESFDETDNEDTGNTFTDDEGDDYKLVKYKEPKFCQKCGQQLNLTQKVVQEWFDQSTGEKVKRYSFHWTCPHPHSFFWNDPHTNVERYGYDLADALTQKEYSSNYSWS